MHNTAVSENVRFERPMVEQLWRSGFHAVDMHFHTNHSDAYTKVRSELGSRIPARRVFVRLGIDEGA